MSDRCPSCDFLHPPIAICACGFCVHADIAWQKDSEGNVRHWPWHDEWVQHYADVKKAPQPVKAGGRR